MKLRPAQASAGLGDVRDGVIGAGDVGAAGGKDFAAAGGRLLGRGRCAGDLRRRRFAAAAIACVVSSDGRRTSVARPLPELAGRRPSAPVRWLPASARSPAAAAPPASMSSRRAARHRRPARRRRPGRTRRARAARQLRAHARRPAPARTARRRRAPRAAPRRFAAGRSARPPSPSRRPRGTSPPRPERRQDPRPRAALRTSSTTRITAGVGALPVSMKWTVAPSAYRSVHGPCAHAGRSAYCSIGAKLGFSTAVSDFVRVADDAARRAEVEQDRPAVGQQQDVVGRDVAVEHAGAVQPLERVEDRLDDGAQPRLVGRRAPWPGAPAQQRAAGAVLHRHVGGAVRLPEPVHANQRGMVEGRQQARLVEERFERPLELLGAVRASAAPTMPAGPRAASSAGHELLERDLAQQRVVEREVDDAEAADAERAKDLELVETRSGGQQARVVETGRRRDRRGCREHHRGGRARCSFIGSGAAF